MIFYKSDKSKMRRLGEHGDAQRKRTIIRKLRDNGCRITEQRKMILDVILESRCSSCKEIYVQVEKLDRNIGIATVYRLVKELENIGVLSRKIVYK